MILDIRSLFSNLQAITATANSTNVYDLGAPGIAHAGSLVQLKRNMGKAGNIPMLVQVNEDFNNLTSLDIVMQSDEDEAFGSAKEVFRVTVLLADLVAGYICPIDKLPRGITERYLRFRYEVTGAAPTTGKISAGFVMAVDGSYQG